MGVTWNKGILRLGERRATVYQRPNLPHDNASLSRKPWREAQERCIALPGSPAGARDHFEKDRF